MRWLRQLCAAIVLLCVTPAVLAAGIGTASAWVLSKLAVVESENGQHVWIRPDVESGEVPTAGLHWERPGSVYADLRGGRSWSRHGYPDIAVIAQDGRPPVLQVSSPDGEVIQVDLFRAAKVLERLIDQE